MALDTYGGLKEAIEGWLDAEHLSEHIDDFVVLAEARHKRDIRIRAMLDRAALTVNARYVDLPAGFLEAKSLRLLTTPLTMLEQVNQHEMNRIRQETTGKPTRYTIHEQFEFDVTPDSSYSGEILFYAALTPLSGANETNALLTLAPDAYLWGALCASAPFLLRDERIPVWENLYRSCVAELNAQQRSSMKVGPLVSRVAGSTP